MKTKQPPRPNRDIELMKLEEYAHIVNECGMAGYVSPWNRTITQALSDIPLPEGAQRYVFVIRHVSPWRKFKALFKRKLVALQDWWKY